MSSELTRSEGASVQEAKPAGAVTSRDRGCLGSGLALLGVVLGALYIINPTAGLIELIPDNIPLFGNVDEAAATTMLVLGLQYLFGRKR